MYVVSQDLTPFVCRLCAFHINGYQISYEPMTIYADMMQMFETGTFDQIHLEQWLRKSVITYKRSQVPNHQSKTGDTYTTKT
ncbi:MAG: hypothetical protein Q8L82_09290 [Nitrosomonas sp.]|nr:hypothetical protein [Nitrosomonas sp.]